MIKTFFTIAAALVVFASCSARTGRSKTEAATKKVLVAYFSCTGNTESAAKLIAEAAGADLYRIRPAKEYTAADLDWNNKSSRSSTEMRDIHSRPELADRNAGIGNYDIIFVGYPIWWDRCPTIINTFLEAYDFSGKTVIPFATSGGSSITNSEKLLRKAYGKNAIWESGLLHTGSSEETAAWARKTVGK